MVCVEEAGVSKGQGADGFQELGSSEGHCISPIPVAITKYLRLSSLQRKGLQCKIRQMHVLMITHPWPQHGGEAGKSYVEKWLNACHGLPLNDPVSQEYQ